MLDVHPPTTPPPPGETSSSTSSPSSSASHRRRPRTDRRIPPPPPSTSPLEEDIRDEAQRNIARIQANQKSFAVYIAWYRDVLKAGREATPSAGFVTFVIPPRVNSASAGRPLDNVWVAAKASAAIAVLPREEVETFGRVSNYAEQAEKAVDAREGARAAEHAVLSRLGLTLAPGETVRVTPENRDELMRAVALHAEGYRQLSTADAVWEGSSDAVLHGVRSLDEMAPYISRALDARPK